MRAQPRPDQRNFRGQISYRCPDEKYGVHCLFKGPPPSDFEPNRLEQLQLGYDHFVLLKNLTRVKTEARLAGGRTRAGLDAGNANGVRTLAVATGSYTAKYLAEFAPQSRVDGFISHQGGACPFCQSLAVAVVTSSNRRIVPGVSAPRA